MAGAKLTVTVGASNSASSVSVSTTGRYKRLDTNRIRINLPQQPLFTTASEPEFWLAVLAVVQAQIEALEPAPVGG